MLRYVFAGAAFGALILAGCGGGGGTSGGVDPNPASTATPTSAPTQTSQPTTQPTTASTPASTPQQMSVGGSTAFVDASNQHTLYVFSADTNGVSNCTSANGCTGIWPPYTAPAGTSATGTGFTLIARSDGSLQWAANGAPLYTYAGDNGAAQSNGQGITSFGGSWSVGRPAASPTATPGNPGQGYGVIRR